ITPMFEDTSLFIRGVGEGSDIVSKEMYTFTDRSDNSLTLRPEGTAPVMRALLSNNLHEQGLPVKLWYSAAMFRYDRPQKGRYRQHHQLGLEAIGTEDPAVDAEVIWLGARLLASAGLPETPLFLNSIGHSGCRGPYVEALRTWLQERRDRLDDDCKRRMDTNPLRVFDCKVPEDRAILADAPTIERFLCDDCRAHFETVQGYLKDAGISYTIEPRLVRGLDYYTRTTFEFQTPYLESQQNTVCGGGRYDGLSELIGGPRLPGIGFGSGIERVLLAAEEAGASTAARGLDAYVIAVGDDERADAWSIVRDLRAEGVYADLAPAERGLKAAFKHANRLGARFAVVIGPDERARAVVTLRDMGSGEQRETGRAALAEALRSSGAGATHAEGADR
ncbi:MAG: histidine--tRNA ligase, partial [Actinomycetota bacterium]